MSSDGRDTRTGELILILLGMIFKAVHPVGGSNYLNIYLSVVLDFDVVIELIFREDDVVLDSGFEPSMQFTSYCVNVCRLV